MPILFHELRQHRLSLLIWTGALAFMLGICVLIYPELAAQMEELSQMFNDMGNFSEAFGMDQLTEGGFLGYFALECGETLGLGGAIFAAIAGATILSKEERDRTAEFLYAHPVSRPRILTEKALSVLGQVLFLNTAIYAIVLACVFLIGETVELLPFTLLFLANFFLQVEIAAVSFGLSSLVRRGSVAVGIGISAGFYFLNIIANLTEDVEFLKYATPFGYTDGSYIMENSALDLKYLIPGLCLAVAGVAVAFLRYRKKDIY